MTTATLPRIERPTLLHHWVLAILLVITAINYIQRNSIGPAETTIRAELGLDRTQTGSAISAFFLAYFILQVPSGWLAQKIGARIALSLYAGVWSLAMGLCGLARTETELYFARFLMGAAQAGIFPCATLILSEWYPPSRRGFATAMLTSFMLIGAAICTPVTGFLLEVMSWRNVFFLYMIPGLLWVLWFALWFRNRPQDHPRVNAAELEIITESRRETPRPASLTPASQNITATPPPRPTSVAQPLNWMAVLFNLSLILICIQQGFRAGANRFYDNYLPTYFQEAKGATIAMAGILTSFPLWAGVVGSLVGGSLSDLVLLRTGRRGLARKGIAIGSLLVGTAFFVLAYAVRDVWLATGLFSVGVFITTFASPCAYALTMDISGKQIAVIFGLTNMAGNAGAYVFTWGLPWVVKLGGWPLALAIFAGLHVAAALCWIPVQAEHSIGSPTSKE